MTALRVQGILDNAIGALKGENLPETTDTLKKLYALTERMEGVIAAAIVSLI